MPKHAAETGSRRGIGLALLTGGMHPTSVALTDAPARTAAPRVLVLRSCRPHVLDEALAATRSLIPSAQFVALTHKGHAEALRVQGIADAIEVPGNRFSALRLPMRLLMQLRLTRFDAVVVPMMFGRLTDHLNLLLLALAIGPRRIIGYSPDAGLLPGTTADARRGLWRAIVHAAIMRFDVPIALLLMAAALVAPRRRHVRQSPTRRVLHVISSWGVGGAQRQLAELLQAYPAGECDAEVFVLSTDGDFATHHLRGHEVRMVPSAAWPSLTLTILELARMCRRERYDVVHTWLFKANVLGVTAARLAGAPRVISSVRNLSLWKRAWDNQPWFRLADVLASHASDLVTVNGESLVADHGRWAWLPHRRMAVVANGLALDGLDLDCQSASRRLHDQLGLPQSTLIVGTVGRLAHEKDHALLLDAWAAAGLPDAHLVIVGDGPLRPALQARIERECTSVTLLGASPRARETMAGFDLFVLPSRIEGFPNVLLEAAMIGVPALSTDVGAARDILCDAVDLVPPADLTALTSRLSYVLGDLKWARERAASRRDFVRQAFTIRRMVARWLSLYDGANQ